MLAKSKGVSPFSANPSQADVVNKENGGVTIAHAKQAVTECNISTTVASKTGSIVQPPAKPDTHRKNGNGEEARSSTGKPSAVPVRR